MAARKSLLIDAKAEAHAAELLQRDQTAMALRAELAASQQKYKAAIRQIHAERDRANAIASLQKIKPKAVLSGKRGRATASPATMLLLCSDWHCEERVAPETVNNLNDFSLEVADQRISELTGRFMDMVAHERTIANIKRIVVWLGGDFISGHIHPDTAEMAALAPLAAARWAAARIRGMLDAICGAAENVVVVTSAGNHGRSNHDKKPRVGTELDHSFEQNMYLTLAAQEQNANCEWSVGKSHLHYLDLDGFVVRFHHGHSYSYNGGIGGIHVPVSKANAAWNAVQRADLTCFGHWHQFSWLRAGKYVSNGSLIGHSAYATKIKAAYEPPCQAAIVVCHKRQEVTRAYPIFCDKDLQFVRGCTNAV